MKRFEALTEPTGETPDPYEKRRLPMANRKRNIQMKFYVTEEEKRLIDGKMAQLPTRRYGAYLRKMAIDGYNEIFSILRGVMKTVSVRLHLLPCHAAEIEVAPGCLDALGDLAAFLRRLQKLRHFGKTSAVAVMGGILPALMQHHDIRYGQGVPGEVCRAVHIEPGINAFQIVLRRQRGGVNLLIVLRLHGKTVVTDGIQRLKAIIQRFIAALELVDGEAAHRLVLRRTRLLHDSSGGLAASAA